MTNEQHFEDEAAAWDAATAATRAAEIDTDDPRVAAQLARTAGEAWLRAAAATEAACA